MVSVRRQRLKAIRAGVNVEKANACSDVSELVELMQDLNKPKSLTKKQKAALAKKIKEEKQSGTRK